MSIDGMGLTIGAERAQGTYIPHYTGLCGQNIMGLSRTNSMSTILTGIQETMVQKISNVLAPKITFLSTCWFTRNNVNPERVLRKRCSKQKSGIDRLRVLLGIKSTQKKWSLGKTLFQWFARSAAKIIPVRFITKNFALDHASKKIDIDPDVTMKFVRAGNVGKNLTAINTQKKQRVQKIVQLPYQKNGVTVYDIEVEGDNCYYANGFLVSNCDAFRYMGVMQNKSRRTNMTESQADDLERRYVSRF